MAKMFLLFLFIHCTLASTPIVLWHGMGDACCMPYSLGPFKKFLEDQIPGVYVKSLMIGDCVPQDLENSYFLSPNSQVEDVCKQLVEDENLKDGFNAIGFSQGSQFLRAVVQRCGHITPPMRNLISLGGQHQGIFGVPNCGKLPGPSCEYIRKLLDHAAYYSWVQKFLVQATYWHDPLDEEKYKKYSHFLSDINNEVNINTTYVDNLKSLDYFVMVKFANDSIVVPKETEWFGFYKPGQDKDVMNLHESELYLQDRLGLKEMDELNKLIFLTSPGNHLQFPEDWFISNIIKYYLN